MRKSFFDRSFNLIYFNNVIIMYEFMRVKNIFQEIIFAINKIYAKFISDFACK